MKSSGKKKIQQILSPKSPKKRPFSASASAFTTSQSNQSSSESSISYSTPAQKSVDTGTPSTTNSIQTTQEVSPGYDQDEFQTMLEDLQNQSLDSKLDPLLRSKALFELGVADIIGGPPQGENVYFIDVRQGDVSDDMTEKARAFGWENAFGQVCHMMVEPDYKQINQLLPFFKDYVIHDLDELLTAYRLTIVPIKKRPYPHKAIGTAGTTVTSESLRIIGCIALFEKWTVSAWNTVLPLTEGFTIVATIKSSNAKRGDNKTELPLRARIEVKGDFAELSLFNPVHSDYPPLIPFRCRYREGTVYSIALNLTTAEGSSVDWVTLAFDTKAAARDNSPQDGQGPLSSGVNVKMISSRSCFVASAGNADDDQTGGTDVLSDVPWSGAIDLENDRLEGALVSAVIEVGKEAKRDTIDAQLTKYENFIASVSRKVEVFDFKTDFSMSAAYSFETTRNQLITCFAAKEWAANILSGETLFFMENEDKANLFCTPDPYADFYNNALSMQPLDFFLYMRRGKRWFKNETEKEKEIIAQDFNTSVQAAYEDGVKKLFVKFSKYYGVLSIINTKKADVIRNKIHDWTRSESLSDEDFFKCITVTNLVVKLPLSKYPILGKLRTA